MNLRAALLDGAPEPAATACEGSTASFSCGTSFQLVLSCSGQVKNLSHEVRMARGDRRCRPASERSGGWRYPRAGSPAPGVAGTASASARPDRVAVVPSGLALP